MNADQTFETVSRLIQMYPGISLAFTLYEEMNGGFIELYHGPAESLLRIDAMAGHANLGRLELHSPGWGVQCGKPADALSFRSRLYIPEGPTSPMILEWFGVFLVWDLKGLGILHRNDANPLLVEWNAALREGDGEH